MLGLSGAKDGAAVDAHLGNLKSAYAGTNPAFDFAPYAHRCFAEIQ